MYARSESNTFLRVGYLTHQSGIELGSGQLLYFKAIFREK